MRSLKLKVISTAILAGVLSTAMAAIDPKPPTPPISSFATGPSGVLACNTESNKFGNAVYHWAPNFTYLYYGTFFTSFASTNYVWNQSCTGNDCTGTTVINCESLNTNTYHNSLSPLINNAVQGYIQSVLNAYTAGSAMPVAKQVVCNYQLNSTSGATCTVE